MLLINQSSEIYICDKKKYLTRTFQFLNFSSVLRSDQKNTRSDGSSFLHVSKAIQKLPEMSLPLIF